MVDNIDPVAALRMFTSPPPPPPSAYDSTAPQPCSALLQPCIKRLKTMVCGCQWCHQQRQAQMFVSEFVIEFFKQISTSILCSVLSLSLSCSRAASFPRDNSWVMRSNLSKFKYVTFFFQDLKSISFKITLFLGYRQTTLQHCILKLSLCLREVKSKSEYFSHTIISKEN